MASHLRNLREKAQHILKNVRGQGLVEYALILVLIAIVAIAAVGNVGKATSSSFSTINKNLQP